MEANHDIHNRSRNRKQERRPRWKKQNAQQQKWTSNNNNHNQFNHPTKNNNNSNDNVTTVTTLPNDAEHEKSLAESLRELCSSRRLIEPPSGIKRRRRVMRDLDTMLCAWSESLLPGSSSYADNIISYDPNDASDTGTAAPSLLSFGSYRLGVHTPDADVDCLVLAPPHVTRDDFFGSWVDVLKGEKRVTDLHPISGAYTPVIKFEMDEIKIDLIFARVNNSKWLTEQRTKNSADSSAGGGNDDDDDGGLGAPGERTEMSVDNSVLVGLDETSVRSVNGVRVSQFLLDLLDGNPARVENFRVALRFVKEWARVHGLYSNVLGFLGGVNWAILVSWVCKRNPDAPASVLLPLFFKTFANWNWPSPVSLALLSKQKQPPKGVKPFPIWDPNENYRDSTHLMPIITPCYPPMNSSYNVGMPQLRRLRDELNRASQLSDGVLSGRNMWEALLEGNGFFKQHANYLQINVIGTNEDEFRSWFGLCESRMRVLIAGLESPVAGVSAYPYAKFFQRRDEGYISSFFVALRFAHSTKRIDLGPLVADFLRVVNDWEGRSLGMDLTIHLVSKQNLPSFVFAKEEAKDIGDATSGLAETPSKPNNHQQYPTGKNECDKQNKTPLPSVSKKKPWDESSPSDDISPLKRTRIN